MAQKPSRRNFIKKVGLSGVTLAVAPQNMISSADEDSIPEVNAKKKGRQYNAPYRGEYLNRVAFPIGGLGAGMFCLEGTGSLSHLSVRHKPDIFNSPDCFAAITVQGSPHLAKVIEGPVPDWKKFGNPGSGNGSGGATTGLPHFAQASFTTRFPFAEIDLEDPAMPVNVRLTGWSPFIPGDDDYSSLPVGALEYVFINKGGQPLNLVFSYHSRNFLRLANGNNAIESFPSGFILSEKSTLDRLAMRSDFAIFTDDPATVVNHCWFRGGWWDPFTMAWNAARDGTLNAIPPVDKDAPGASLFIPFKLSAGGIKSIRVMMSWYTPDSDLQFGRTVEKTNCDPASGCCSSPSVLMLDKYDEDFAGEYYKPWYSKRFKDVREVASFWKDNYQDLRSRSALFRDAFYASTLPPEVLEAVAANLTILKSPTVLRQYDGRMWNYEGCGDTWGCCHGSCTHVWNYAQAVPHLFPALERSLRHTEFCESQSAEGHQTFRAALPIRPQDHDFHAAADGQLGGIMKAYREWRISGDNDWLRKMYPMVRRSLDYCIQTWDPRHAGLIEEPHHNTYDIEFWGPDGMHNSFYLGALHALISMGRHLGEDISLYEDLAKKGKAYTETELYNGQYFIQKIQYEGLRAPSPLDPSTVTFGGGYSEEAKTLLYQEGPKYQYGTGCLSDGVLGSWIAEMCGLPDPLDRQKVRSHLQAVHKYNLKSTLVHHANPQRPSFALGEDGGLILCSWPKGGKLSLPFVYSDEVWTGIEYQVAAHLMLHGEVEAGLQIVRTCRDRYSGKVRNPFNEYECGHWYARAMSSYGLLQALTGVRYDAVDKTLYIHSQVGDFISFLATERGFGTVTLQKGKPSLKVYYGQIDVQHVLVSGRTATLNA